MADIQNWISVLSKDIDKISKANPVQNAVGGIYDINANPVFNPSIDLLEEIEGAQTKSAVVDILNKNNIPLGSFAKHMVKQTAKSELTIQDIQKSVRTMIEAQKGYVGIAVPINIYNLVKKFDPCKF